MIKKVYNIYLVEHMFLWTKFTLQAGRVAADRKPTKLAAKLVRGFVGTH